MYTHHRANFEEVCCGTVGVLGGGGVIFRKIYTLGQILIVGFVVTNSYMPNRIIYIVSKLFRNNMIIS